MTASSMLFAPYSLGRLTLRNRLVMAPLYLAYPDPDGTVNRVVLDHYREMAASGVGMVVVENVGVNEAGIGSPRTMRTDHDRYIEGLASLARVIKAEGVAAVMQINHVGRYGYSESRLAPSPVDGGRGVPREMTAADLDAVVQSFAGSAARVKAAGFDGVEIHGGTGYLIVQFLSPRTNHRADEFGGCLENRARLPLKIIKAVREAVGPGYPVGYRFQADELLPHGLGLDESRQYATMLTGSGLAYLSVMVGNYDSFFTPAYLAMEKKEGYMVGAAQAIKEAAGGLPVITAGRIQTPETAEGILREGRADLIGLARVLLADPLWPRKAQGLEPGPIIPCEPTCSLCQKRVFRGQPAFCSRWTKEKRLAFLAKIGGDAAEDNEPIE